MQKEICRPGDQYGEPSAIVAFDTIACLCTDKEREVNLAFIC
jgi:hypothetical protein